MRSHRTFLHLAQGLTESGFHVLRFDYFGCGDSEGCFDECDFRRWADDVVTAVDEMRSGSGVSRVCLCGLRLGGTIAAMIDAERHGIDGLILWDPVVQGARYLDEFARTIEIGCVVLLLSLDLFLGRLHVRKSSAMPSQSRWRQAFGRWIFSN